MPWHPSGEHDLLAAVVEPMELAFDLQPVGTVVQAGSRLRITLTGADRASHQPLDREEPVHMRVLRGGDYPSRISLPVLDGGA